MHDQYDVIVVGSGMGGLAAAIRAEQAGSDVLVFEKGPRPGGSVPLGWGIIWTFESVSEVHERIPGGKPALQQAVVESLETALDWLTDLGVEYEDHDFAIPGWGKKVDPEAFVSTLLAAFDGDLALETAMHRVRTDEQDRVIGVDALGATGDVKTAAADSVVLATGGFQGNDELVNRYITENTENLRLRSNPYSTGDGFLAARELGAKATRGMDSFYGHCFPGPDADVPPSEFIQATQYYGPYSVALDTSGRRFADESESLVEETLTQDVAKLADGKAVYVLDAEAIESRSVLRVAEETVEQVERFGGHSTTADSRAELAETLSSWGFNGHVALETIESYNEHIRTEPAVLDPPRTRNRYPIDTPPFVAVEVQPAITFTMGGLDVTDEMAVLRRSRTASTLDRRYEFGATTPAIEGTIPGLFAAGADVGNISNRYYMGGLATALVTGRIAGGSAAGRAST